MVKVGGPLFCLFAHGWLGRTLYQRTGLVVHPYPFALLQKIHIPYRMPAFSLFPYKAFIAQYYSRLGWCYQLRRTWHGIITAAIHPPLHANKHTPAQDARQAIFRDGVLAWQSLTTEEKRIWDHYRYPVHPSGYNRFLRWYLLRHFPAIVLDYLLTEAGENLMTENGEFIRIDGIVSTTILTEAEENIITEAEENITQE